MTTAGAYDGVVESATATPAFEELESYRRELTAYSYRMLGSPFEAEDAVQETLIRAWRSIERFEGRAALRSWLYRIATNVCLDMLGGRERRAPADGSRPRGAAGGREPARARRGDVDRADPRPRRRPRRRETIRLAFVAALQHLPPRQRAVLILCEVLRWQASEAAELLETSVASVNSALQRARATLETANMSAEDTTDALGDEAERELLARFVEAFEAYDIERLTALIHEDATQSMPPYDLWLSGRDDIFTWWFGPGIGCKGSRVIPAGLRQRLARVRAVQAERGRRLRGVGADGARRLSDGRIGELTFFLGTERLFPLFGLPPRLDP